MKLGSTLILMKDYLVIGQWTSAAICSLANALCGLLTVMQFNSSFPTTVPTQPFCACKCVWCIVMPPLSIEMIITLLTQTIGPNWAWISVLSTLQGIFRAHPVTSSREPTTIFLPNATGEYALLLHTPPDNTVDTTDAAHCQAIISTLLIDNCCGLCHLSNVPIKLGKFKKVTPPTAKAWALLNDKLPCYAQQVLEFSWAVHSFHGGHFASAIQSWNLPFQVRLACDPHESGRSLFQEFTSCHHIFSSATDLLNHIRTSGDTSVIHGYLIHSPRFRTSKTTTHSGKFRLQLSCNSVSCNRYQ